ncbi:RteC protein [Rikenella microfusus]|uniref:RteC protein n=1 Tax=Rikenella microfusus TaxID=28139 RepID=A0A379MTE7_9BACT|nr:RteC protein [Rikenella microfusus]
MTLLRNESPYSWNKIILFGMYCTHFSTSGSNFTPCNVDHATRREKNAAYRLYLTKALELVESGIELAKILFRSFSNRSTAGTSHLPPLRWVFSQQALLELGTALHGCGALVDEKGAKPTFTVLMRVLCRTFGIVINDIYVKRTQMFDRSQSVTPFLNRMVETVNQMADERLK